MDCTSKVWVPDLSFYILQVSRNAKCIRLLDVSLCTAVENRNPIKMENIMDILPIMFLRLCHWE